MQTTVQPDRLSLAFFESLFDTSPLGFGVLDAQRRFVRVNEPLGRMLGGTDLTLRGRTIDEVAPDPASTLVHVLADVERSQRPSLHVEVAGSAPDDDTAPPRFWDVSVYPVTVAHDLVGVGMVVVDVTQRVSARLRLEEQAGAVYEHVVQSLAVAKMALELGNMEEAALDAIEEALAAAKRIVSSVVFADRGLEPGL